MSLVLLALAALQAPDYTKLPPGAWVGIKPVTRQPDDPDEKGQWMNVGWNKLVYDPAAKRVLFYDRWHDRKHGGYTIYGNCLFSFDPASAELTPLAIDHWRKEEVAGGGYRTLPRPEQAASPSPCSRHVYHGFDLVGSQGAVFIANGANQGARHDDGRSGHDLCADTWRFDLARKSWTRVESQVHPPNRLEDGMAWCPDTDSIVYAGHGRIWILDLAQGRWREAKARLPRTHMGMTVFFDPPRRRMLLAGGGDYDQWKTKAGGFNSLYAFDPKAETLTRLADGPTALCRGALARDPERDVYYTVAMFKGEGIEQPSGLFAYDPAKDAWSRAAPAAGIPLEKGWMPLCWDAARRCLIGMVGESFYACRPDAGR
jgi:hypothetical protein